MKTDCNVQYVGGDKDESVTTYKLYGVIDTIIEWFLYKVGGGCYKHVSMPLILE